MNRLKVIREEKGLSQKELAEIVGLSQETISLYESGDRTPNVYRAINIAGTLGVEVGDIFLPKTFRNEMFERMLKNDI